MDVTDETFGRDVIYKSKQVPILVDFWGAWCSPCLTLKPILEGLEKEYNGRFILAKLNVDENPITTKRYSIRGIPAVKLFKNSDVVDEFVGLMTEQAIKDFIDKNL